MAVRWEYLSLPWPWKIADLNALGSQGWELVAVTQHNGAVFKQAMGEAVEAREAVKHISPQPVATPQALPQGKRRR